MLLLTFLAKYGWFGCAAVLLALSICYGCWHEFNKFMAQRFRYSFFSRANLTVCVCALLSFMAAQLLYQHQYRAWAYVSIAVGLASFVVLVFKNIKATSFGWGLFGSLIQIPILYIAAYFVVAGIAVWLMCKALASMNAMDRHVEPETRRRREEQETYDWEMSPSNTVGFWKGKNEG